MKKLALALALCLTGCVATSVVDSAYVKADQDTKTAIEPLIRATATTQPDLAPALDNKLASWQNRIDSAKARLSAQQGK